MGFFFPHPVYSMLFDEAGSVAGTGHVKEILLPKGFLDFRQGETREVDGIMGAAMMFRRRDLLAVGGLNEELYFYGEENVVCAYLRNKLGLKTYVLPESTISHVHGGSTSTSFNQLSDRLIMESYNVMVRETVGYIEFFLNCLIRLPVYLGMFAWGYLV